MPPETTNEVDKFFDGLPKTDQRVADIFGDTPIRQLDTKEDDKNDPEKGTAEDTDPEKGETEARKNRQHRRAEAKKWEDRLTDKERDIIAREARLEERERSRLAAIESDPNVDPLLVQMYGDNSDAIRIHQQLLQKSEKAAEERALKRFQESRAEEERNRAKFESEVLEGLESIEDTYDVDLTADSPRSKKARTEFLGVVEKLSPKDANGSIIAYVDFNTAWQMYAATQTRETKQTETTSRAKEISAQSMQKGAPSATAPKAVTPGFDGWRKDFGVGT